MNGDTLYTLTTHLLGGNAMDEDLFYQLLNLAKDQREMMRDWMKLRTEDTTITFTSSDTYLSTKTLPARFLRTYAFYDEYGNLNGPFLITSSGSKLPLIPIKFEERYSYKDMDGYYYIDVKNGTIGRTGTTAGTLHLFFLQGTVDITETTSWGLPPSTGYGALLAYDVAIQQRGSIDWDRITSSQIPYDQRMINQSQMNLATWDARLQQAELGI